MKNLIIFDFDGVVADSEPVANTVLAEMVTELGLPTTRDQSYDRYMGRRSADIAEMIAGEIGHAVPVDFLATLHARACARLQQTLQPVSGVIDFIAQFKHHAHAIASSSAPDKLALCLKKIALTEHFGANVFSATMVARGKPDPDIFLLAATRMKAHPDQCIVIDDSPSGVKAGRAAGMTTVGLLAGSHIRPTTRTQLAAAGAHYIAPDYAAVTAYLRRLGLT